jgi:hypothetical protein
VSSDDLDENCGVWDALVVQYPSRQHPRGGDARPGLGRRTVPDPWPLTETLQDRADGTPQISVPEQVFSHAAGRMAQPGERSVTPVVCGSASPSLPPAHHDYSGQLRASAPRILINGESVARHSVASIMVSWAVKMCSQAQRRIKYY